MLVLRRREGENLVIRHPGLPGDVKVKVLALEGNKVKLGIIAPRSVLIIREELLQTPKEPEQGEHSGTWLAADREEAKADAGKLGRAYIEDLENAVRLSDLFWTAMSSKTRTPEQNQLSDELLDALADVNFLAETDGLLEEEERQKEVAHV